MLSLPATTDKDGFQPQRGGITSAHSIIRIQPAIKILILSVFHPATESYPNCAALRE